VHQKVQLKCGRVERHEGEKDDIINDVSKKREGVKKLTKNNCEVLNGRYVDLQKLRWILQL
jgi:hypothetical protein